MEEFNKKKSQIQKEIDKGLLHPGEGALEIRQLHEEHGGPHTFSEADLDHISDYYIQRAHAEKIEGEAKEYFGGFDHPDAIAYLYRNYNDRRPQIEAEQAAAKGMPTSPESLRSQFDSIISGGFTADSPGLEHIHALHQAAAEHNPRLGVKSVTGIHLANAQKALNNGRMEEMTEHLTNAHGSVARLINPRIQNVVKMQANEPEMYSSIKALRDGIAAHLGK